MATKFNKEDLGGCFALDCDRPPSFRLITLEGEGKDANGDPVEAGVGVTLLCDQCAADQVSEYADEIAGEVQSDVPLLGLMLFPMQLTQEQVRELREEITEQVPTENNEADEQS
jgi:hypothetical protein